jgi:hypothetical protein
MIMSLRKIAIEANKKREAGVSTDEINSFIRGRASLLGLYVEMSNGCVFEICLTATGETIRYNQNVYAYSAS